MNIIPSNNQANLYSNYYSPATQSQALGLYRQPTFNPNSGMQHILPFMPPRQECHNPIKQIVEMFSQLIGQAMNMIGSLLNSLTNNKSPINDCGGPPMRALSDGYSFGGGSGNSFWSSALDFGKSLFSGNSAGSSGSSGKSSSGLSGIADFGKSVFKMFF